MTVRPIGILYEHPEWFRLLFAELERRGTPFEPIYVNEHWFDPAERDLPYSLLVNRVSPSSYLRDHAASILYTRQLLAHLKQIGAPVVNGYDAYTLETSKALQLLLFDRLGVGYPRARVVNHPSQVAAAAEGLTFPVIVKPNVGGSGALMQRFESPAALRDGVRAGVLDFGIDRTALVQEYLAPAEGSIVRVEILDGQYLYAIRIFANPDEGFNLCPADICRTDEPGATASQGAAAPITSTPAGAPVVIAPAGANGAVGAAGAACDYGAGAVAAAATAGALQAAAGETCDYGATAVAAPVISTSTAAPAKKPLRVEAYTPPRDVVMDALRLVKAGGLDVGGVEYLVSQRDGRVYFYDVNALSNFVTDAPAILGFDPTARFAEYLAARAGLRLPTAV